MAEAIRVVWGEQLIAPRQYNNFKIGPFEMTTTVRDDETDEQAFDRAYAFLDERARATYKTKIAAFELAFREANAVVGGRGR